MSQGAIKLAPIPTNDALEALLHLARILLIGPYSSYFAFPECEMASPALFSGS